MADDQITDLAGLNRLPVGAVIIDAFDQVGHVRTFAWDPETLTGFMGPGDGDPRYIAWCGTEITCSMPLTDADVGDTTFPVTVLRESG